MDNLRWILLAVGVLFLAALALWELLRKRDASARDDAPAVRREPGLDPADLPSEEGPVLRGHADLRRDPPLVMLDDVDAADAVPVGVATEVAVDRPRAFDLDIDIDIDVDDESAPSAVIHWPPLEQDRILWLRLLPRSGGRFAGRPVRQALVGRGLVLGPQDIFHWADREGRVLASVASLTRPGSFVLSEMDGQSYAGLNLFAVLPGPLPPRRALEELLDLARELAGRLGGDIQDDQGRPLDEALLAEMRAGLELGEDSV
jgi:FtsZ-interacting cell division protein ZipA